MRRHAHAPHCIRALVLYLHGSVVTTKSTLEGSSIGFCRMAWIDTPFSAASSPTRFMIPRSSLEDYSRIPCQTNTQASTRREAAFSSGRQFNVNRRRQSYCSVVPTNKSSQRSTAAKTRKPHNATLAPSSIAPYVRTIRRLKHKAATKISRTDDVYPNTYHTILQHPRLLARDPQVKPCREVRLQLPLLQAPIRRTRQRRSRK